MKLALVSNLLVLLLVFSSCIVSGDFSGRTMVDNVLLDYENTSTMFEIYESANLTIDVGSGNVDLKGVPGRELQLKVAYMEYEPGDAEIIIKDDLITYQTKSGKPALIMDVSGTIPQDLSLLVDTGSGNVKIAKMQSSNKLIVDSGSGKVAISDCRVDRIVVDTGSGNVDIEDSVITDFAADTGSGNVRISHSSIESADLDTGSGNIYLNDSLIHSRIVDTGSGKVYEEGAGTGSGVVH